MCAALQEIPEEKCSVLNAAARPFIAEMCWFLENSPNVRSWQDLAFNTLNFGGTLKAGDIFCYQSCVGKRRACAAETKLGTLIRTVKLSQEYTFCCALLGGGGAGDIASFSLALKNVVINKTST